MYTETISAFRFRLYWPFVVSALQDAGGCAISLQNNLELHLGCHTCWLSYFTLVCLWCGRTVLRAGGRSVYGHVITKFSRMGRLLHFLNPGAPLARFARKSSVISFPRNFVCVQSLFLYIWKDNPTTLKSQLIFPIASGRDTRRFWVICIHLFVFFDIYIVRCSELN